MGPRTQKNVAFLVAAFVGLVFLWNQHRSIPKILADGTVITTNNEEINSGVAQPSSKVFKRLEASRSLFADGQQIHAVFGIEETDHLQKSYGFNMFQRLYMKNGVLFIVTSDPKSYPELKTMFSTGISTDQGSSEERFPTDVDIQIISPADALDMLGNEAVVIEDLTIWINDAGTQFLNHYYHFCCEVFMGIWKLYSFLDPNITPSGRTKLAPPKRMMLPRAYEEEWRDFPGLNSFIMKSVFPNMVMEYRFDWEDMGLTGQTYVFENIIVEDRSAAHLAPYCSGRQDGGVEFFKAGADVMNRTNSSPNWWMPIRNTALRSIGAIQKLPPAPVITYLSRQDPNKMHARQLQESDHEELMAALIKMADDNHWSLEVPDFPAMPPADQIELASRTTILMGLHGNGLSHQMWMAPTNFSTVIELFQKDGFNYDYSLPAISLGHKHYGFQYDKWIDTEVELPHINYPDDFHSSMQRLNVSKLIELIEKRLEGWPTT